MSPLAPTPPHLMVDSSGRPYFMWDVDMTLETLRAQLRDPDPEVRAYFVGKVMRQAKPDDVFFFLSAREIADLWPRLSRYLGRSRPFWRWLLDTWKAQGRAGL